MMIAIPLEKDDIIQIVPTHKWGGCLAVVDEPKVFGCQCYVTIPSNEEASYRVYIRLAWEEFEKIGAKAHFVPGESNDDETETDQQAETE